MSLVNKCKSILHEELKEQVKKKIENVKKQEELVRENGVSTVDIEEFISKAKIRVEEKHFESAIQLVGEAKSELNEAMEGVVEKKEKELEKSIGEAEEIECSTRDIKKGKENIEELKRKGNFSEAYNSIEKAMEKLEELKFQRVLKTIAESREYFIKGKEIGIDISEPMNLLSKARDSLKDGDHKGAIDWAQAGREKVRELVEEHERFEMRIAEAERTVDALAEVNIELPEASDIISQIQDALEEKNYELAEEKLKEFDSYVDKKAYPEIMDLVEKLELLVLTAEEMGLDVAEYVEQAEIAIANTKSEEYAKAGGIALNTKQELESVITENLNQRMKNLRSVIEKVKEEMAADEYSEEIEGIKHVIKKVEKAFGQGNYRLAHESLQRVSEEVRKWRVGEAEERFSQAKELVSLIKNMDVKDLDVDEYEKRLEEVSDAFQNDEFTKVIALSEEIIKDLSQQLKTTSEEVFDRAKMETVKAKKAGVDIEELRKRLINCKKYLQSKNYTKAIKHSIKVEEEARRTTEKRKSSYGLISSLSANLIKLKKEGKLTDVKPFKELLLKAKNSFQDKDYTQAESLALQAQEKIKELKARSEFESKLREFREDMEYASSLDINISDIEDVLDVNSIMKEGDFNKGLEKIKETRELLDEKMSQYIEPEIQRTQEIIDSAKDVGVDLSHPKEIFERAKDMWETGDFRHTLEYIEKSRAEIETIKNRSKRAVNSLKQLKESIANAKDLHADVSGAEADLKRAVEALKEDRYEDAIEFIKEGEESVDAAEMKRVYSILQTFNKKIADVRKEGVNTAFAENLLRRAEKAMDAGKYNEAINLAMQSEGEVERIELQKEIAVRSISTTNKKLDDAKEKGVKVSEAEKLLEQATQAYKGGFYVKAFDKAVKSGEVIKEQVKFYQDASKKLRNLQESIDIISGLDIGEDELKRRVEDIDRLMRRGKYGEALKKSKEADEYIVEMGDDLKTVIEGMEKTVESLKSKGEDVGEAPELIEETREALKRELVVEACKLAKEVKAEFGGDIVEEYGDFLEETKDLLKMANKFGASTSDTAELIEEAESLREEDISKARDKAKEALDNIESVLEPYSPKISLKVHDKLERERWNQLNVELENAGRGVAKSPEIVVQGAEVKKVDFPSMLKAGAVLKLTLELKPTEDEVKLKALGTRIFDQKELSHEVVVEVVDKQYELIEASGDESCAVCGDPVEKGLEVIRCTCGDVLHKDCADEKCQNCGNRFKLKKKGSTRVDLKI
ncbi:MAG: hypothetical protein R6U17_09985 [Thermoplasmata archaeon]